jgi:hypothetical protein
VTRSEDPWHEEIAVLERGLPLLPPALPDDALVPVARWVGPRFGAVMYVGWDGHESELGRYVSSEIYVFRRTDDGWASTNSGGGGWFDPPLVRPNLPSDAVALDHFHAGSGYVAAFGRTGVNAETIEVVDSTGVTTHGIDSPLGVFIVVADRDFRAMVRVRASDGRVLLERGLGPVPR